MNDQYLSFTNLQHMIEIHLWTQHECKIILEMDLNGKLILKHMYYNHNKSPLLTVGPSSIEIGCHQCHTCYTLHSVSFELYCDNTQH